MNGGARRCGKLYGGPGVVKNASVSDVAAIRNEEVTPVNERVCGVPQRPLGQDLPRLSWAATASGMAAAGEDWSEWEMTVADGLDAEPWTTTMPTARERRNAPR